MFKQLFSRGRSAIGLDIGSRTLRMIQLEPTTDAWRVVAATSRVLPSDLPDEGPQRNEAISQAIRQIVEDTPFKGRNVVSCLPSSAVHYKSLRLPRMPADELANAVAWEAADRLHISADDMQIQFFDAGEVRQGDEVREEVIVMAATKKHVQEHVDTVVSAGLEPVAVEATSSALSRCFGLAHAPEDEVVVVVDIGFSTSKVLIVRNGRVLFFKNIELGGQAMDLAVSSKMDLSLGDAADLRHTLANSDEADNERLFGSSRRETIELGVFDATRPILSDIAKEVQLCLRYYSVTFRGRRPETALLVGGEASTVLHNPVLSEGAGISLQLGNPFHSIEGVSEANFMKPGSAGSEWAVATGLSLRSDAKTLLDRRNKAKQEVAA